MLLNLLKSNKTVSTAALTATAVIGCVSQAQAQIFTGTSSGQFGLPANPTDSTFLSNQNGGTNNRLTSGIPGPGSFPNYVQFDGTGFSSSLDSLFDVGTLTYQNGSINNGSGFNGNFPLEVALAFTSPINSTESFDFLFNILNTPNNTGDPVLDGDRLRFSTAGVSDQSFTYKGKNYTLKLVGFSSDSGNTIVDEFNAPEESIATASLFARITVAPDPTPVPEPTSIAGVSLLGMYFVARRNRRNSLTITKGK